MTVRNPFRFRQSRFLFESAADLRAFQQITRQMEQAFPAASFIGVHPFAVDRNAGEPFRVFRVAQVFPCKCVDLAEELGGVSAMISERFENEKVKVMPSTGDISYIWSPLSSLFNDVATDNTTRDKPIYTSPEALKGALNKMVEDIKSAIALGKN